MIDRRRAWATAAVVPLVCAVMTLFFPTWHARASEPVACSPAEQTLGGATIWTFTTVGACSWTPPEGLTNVDVLVVGGGGGGGAIAAAGGGGGGGVLFGSQVTISSGPIDVQVGAGGAGGMAAWETCRGASGSNSLFGNAIALGGGGGGCYNTGEVPDRYGTDGGSGGGHGEVSVARAGAVSTQTAPAGFVAYGNAGGAVGVYVEAGSGGGGAGAPGASPVPVEPKPHVPGAGGDGRAFDISGALTYYAGGGGGGTWKDAGVTGAAGGAGGGGTGGGPSPELDAGVGLRTAGNGLPNTGGGGGGGGFPGGTFSTGGNGGSGIVIVRTGPPLSSSKALTAFSIVSPAATGTIDAGAHTVAVTVPSGTNVSALVATFTASASATVKVGATAQVSGTTSNDFSAPVTYTVTAEDGTTQDWVVTVSVAASLSSAKALTAFSFVSPAATGTIDAGAHTVAVTVPSGTNVSALVATFTASASATVKVGATAQVSGTTSNDFSAPVTYTVTAEDGTTQDWVVTVVIATTPGGGSGADPSLPSTGPGTGNGDKAGSGNGKGQGDTKGGRKK